MATPSRGGAPVPATFPAERREARAQLVDCARCYFLSAVLAASISPAFGQQAPGGAWPGASRPPPDTSPNSAPETPDSGAPVGARAGQLGSSPRPPTLVISGAILFTATDNADLAVQPRRDYLVEGRLNLRLNLPYRRLRGFADYTLAAVHFGSGDESDEFLNALDSELTAELIEQHGFVDVAASIGQQMRSAFGAATLSQGVASESSTVSPSVANANRVESAMYRVAPYFRGRLGDEGQFEARAEQSDIRFRGFDGNDYRTQRAQLLADGGVRPQALRWRSQLSGTIYDFESGRRTSEVVFRGDLGWAFDEEKVVSLIAGREGNNFQTAQRRYGTIYGASLAWRPSERTQFYAEGLHRFFGTEHTVTLNHRLSRMAIVVSDSRAVTPPNQFSDSRLASAFDVLFLQFAGVEPDPARRRTLVQDTLLRNGIDPHEQIISDFMTNSVMVVRAQTLGLSWTHVRDIVTLGVARTDSRRADTLTLPPPADDFASTNRVDQVGAIASWAHRLTPTSTLTLVGGLQKASGSLPSQSTTLRSVSLLWSKQLGQVTTLALSGRHDRFTSQTSPYRANSVTASLRTQF